MFLCHFKKKKNPRFLNFLFPSKAGANSWKPVVFYLCYFTYLYFMINIQLMLVTVITFLQFSFFYTVISFPRVLHVFSNVLTNKPIFFNYSWC